MDAMRKPVHSKPPVSLGMYRSSYKRDYRWLEEGKPPTEEDVQKLRAKEFTVPQEPRPIAYYDNVVGEGKELTAAPGTAQSGKQEGTALSARALQQAREEQRKHLSSILPLAPEHYPTSELTASQEERPERLRALSNLQNELSSSQHLLAAAGSPGAEGMLLHRQKLEPGWGTYEHFMLETGQAQQREGQKNKNLNVGSSVLVKECPDPERRTTYSTDFQCWPAVHSGCCTANKEMSHIFTKENFYQNHWVSEYKENYSVCLQKLNQASQASSGWLSSASKPLELSSQSEVALGTAQ